MGHGVAALALTLGLQARAVEPRGAESARAEDAVPAPGERPLYRAVLEQYARLGTGERARAREQLERWLEEWAESGFGLEGVPDPDRTLASATVLTVLATEPGWAEELQRLLTEIEARLDELARPEPDLALALAQGWGALLTLPLAEEIPVEERVARLRSALRAAETIAPDDQRDAFGCRLAHDLHRHLRAARLGSEAAEMLEIGRAHV